MAVTKAATTSQAYTEGSGSGASSFILTRRVAFDTAYDISVVADMQTVKAACIDDNLTVFATLSDSNELGRMRLRTFTITPVPGSAGKVFDCSARWDGMYFWAALKDLNAANASRLALPVEVDMDSSPRMVAMYRSPGFTTSPAADTSTTTDIGGTRVDYGERAVQALIPQVKMRVSLVFDCSRSSPAATLNSLYDRVATHQGRWNTNGFLHWPTANQVYCESANISHIRDEYYRVSYVFIWDQWYGAEQLPKVEASGTVARDSNGAAQTVTWKNIVRGNIDHNLIFNDQPDSALAKQMALEGTWLTYP
jgi:hypothetical protein